MIDFSNPYVIAMIFTWSTLLGTHPRNSASFFDCMQQLTEKRKFCRIDLKIRN